MSIETTKVELGVLSLHRRGLVLHFGHVSQELSRI
jgi:hypothetical protein